MSELTSPLILPGEWEFEETLASVLPFGWQDLAHRLGGDYGFVVDSESGLLRVESGKGVREYLEGGEYDERLEAIELDEFDGFENG